jgi:hypothetical protein
MVNDLQAPPQIQQRLDIIELIDPVSGAPDDAALNIASS